MSAQYLAAAWAPGAETTNVAPTAAASIASLASCLVTCVALIITALVNSLVVQWFGPRFWRHWAFDVYTGVFCASPRISFRQVDAFTTPVADKRFFDWNCLT